MSRFEETKSIISHWKDNKKIVSIEASMYAFGEAQSTGTEEYYNFSTWEWNNKTIKIREVGIHPKLDYEQQ